MRFMSKSLLSCTALIALAACTTVEMDGGQYWQRSSVSEAIYAEGPKAQQMLNRDISRCVVELRELEGLGQVKDAIPTDKSGKLLDPDEKELSDWDTPERDGHLLAEHSDYHDFDGCMLAKGWERIKYVPYDVADKSKHTWYVSHIDYGYDPRDASIQAPHETNEYND
jgi:hypothetical protein